MRQLRWMLVTLAMIGTAACGEDGDVPEGTLEVVATTTILGDVVIDVVGDDAHVVVLMPIGADPHDFSPSAQQVAAINRADLVVANGFGLEEGLGDVLEAAAADGVEVLEVAPLVAPLPGADEDPHFWLDPLRMAEAVVQIGSSLDAVDDSVDWSAMAAGYNEELAGLHDEIETILDRVPELNRKLVTNHDALSYFAERYGFEVVGVIIPGGSTLGDPSSEDLAELVAVIEAEQVRAIFAETTESSSLAEAVAAEVGFTVEVVDLYTGSLGEDGSGAETYGGMLTVNAKRIADALG